MNETTTFVEESLGKSEDRNLFQIDFLKALMIFLVIFDHTIPWSIKGDIGVALWERISIPVFLVIMGFNLGYSYKSRGQTSLKQFYSWSYWKRKFWRFIFPYLVIYLVSTIIGLILYDFDFELMYFSQTWDPDGLYNRFRFIHLIIGILPFYGPGIWFLPVIFSAIIILPLLYKGFCGKLIWAGLTLLLCYVLEIVIQLYIFFFIGTPPFPSWEAFEAYIFIVTNILFMITAVALGMWFSRNPNIFAKQNLFMFVLFPLSLIYLINYQFFDFRIQFIRGDYNLFVFPYSAFLFLVALKLLPKKSDNLIAKGISVIGKSTYHILLTQIFYLGIAKYLYGNHYCASILGISTGDPAACFGHLIINLIICVPAGIFWWYLESIIRKKIKTRK
ncbi:MAG: acyltransferase family protein [Candidatus Hodarchaeota archaeon]